MDKKVYEVSTLQKITFFCRFRRPISEEELREVSRVGQQSQGSCPGVLTRLFVELRGRGRPQD